MNERIKQLATEVGISVDYLNTTKQWTLIEALAEKIIRECENIIEFQDVDPAFKNRMAHAIKKHFGVES